MRPASCPCVNHSELRQHSANAIARRFDIDLQIHVKSRSSRLIPMKIWAVVTIANSRGQPSLKEPTVDKRHGLFHDLLLMHIE